MSVVHQSVVPKEKERNIIIQSICIDVAGAVTASFKVAAVVRARLRKNFWNAKEPQTTKGS